MKWVSPWAFSLFILLGLSVLFYLFFLRKSKGTVLVSSLMFFRGVNLGWRARFMFLIPLMKYVAIGFAIFALARPQKADTKVNKNVEGIDIMMVLDTSDSMLIEDMEPNRIEASKNVMRNFVRARDNDRIGLVVFSGEAFTRCPLTLDHDILIESLNSVDTEGLKQGTAIGVALANAVGRLKDSTAKTRVIVLLTDGESNSGTVDPYTALDIAKGYGIKVYTIGAGIDGQAQLPVIHKDAFGRTVKTYQPIHSSINEDLLKKIADDTGGKFFRASDGGTLKSVFSQIDKLEKTKIQTHQYVRYSELFPPILLIGVFLYILQMVLGRTILARWP